MRFNEKTFLWAMTTRSADCRVFAAKFEPSWLNNGEYASLLTEIFEFAKKHGVPPSFSALHEVIANREPEVYKNKVKALLDDLQKQEPDLSEMVYTIEEANKLSIIRSIQKLTSDPTFLLKQERGEGTEILQDVHRWLNMHMGVDEDQTFTLDEAVNHLYQQQTFKEDIKHIETGIECIDEWCGGGLRPGQLGLMMAPTGHGKSVALIVAAQKIASIQELPVWYVTNELTMEEATERFLARITGVNLTKIIGDPLQTMNPWKQHAKDKYNKRLWISEVNREVSTDELEAEMMRRANLHGILPKVICLDFMERMKPNGTGYNRDQSWNWLGAIAQDLARFAKRHKILVWTACQTNRGGLKADSVDESMIQGSIKHLQEATAMVGMSQLRIDADNVFMKWKPLKMRQSAKPNEAVFVKCDLSTMTITNERYSKEDIDSMRSSKEEETDATTPGSPTNVLAVKNLSPLQKQKMKQKGNRFDKI